MINPSNTKPCLHKALPDCSYHPQDLRKGNANNYFRVVTTDDYQGPAMSSYAYTTLKSTKVGVRDDSTVFGVGIANTFEANIKALGGTTLRKNYKKDQTSALPSILLTFT